MNIGFEAKRIFHNKTGLGNYSRDLIRILSFYFPENQYYLYNPKNNKKHLFEVNNTNVFEKKPFSNFYTKFYNLWRQKGVVNDLQRDNIAVFHGLSGELPSGLNNISIKSVVTIHDLIFVKYPNLYTFFDRKIHYYKFKKAVQDADVVIAISEQTKKDIIEFLRIDPIKIKVIYQGCHAIFKETFSETEYIALSKKYHLPKNFVLNVGTIEKRKNILLVIKALKDSNIPLIIVGNETAYASEIKTYIQENNCDNPIIFLKGLSIRELAILYQKSKIFVYPSLYEGFGIPIIEALYSKTPVITTRGGVFPEAGGENSIYIDPTNVEEMKAAILNLWQNEALCKSISESGYLFVQKFNDEKIANELMDVYQNLVS